MIGQGHRDVERLDLDTQQTDYMRPASVRLVLQPEQRLVVTDEPDGYLFLVTSGVLMLEARVAADQRRVLEFLYSGDVFPTADAPRLPGTLLVAAAPSELARYRTTAIEAAARGDTAHAGFIKLALAHRSARRVLHLASLAEPNAEGRLADFLVEAALYLGTGTEAGRKFDVPFTRDQIASYLALNPDTLSRLFTRFKQRGLLSISNRHALVPDWAALCQASPLAEAMGELASRRPRAT